MLRQWITMFKIRFYQFAGDILSDLHGFTDGSSLSNKSLNSVTCCQISPFIKFPDVN